MGKESSSFAVSNLRSVKAVLDCASLVHFNEGSKVRSSCRRRVCRVGLLESS